MPAFLSRSALLITALLVSTGSIDAQLQVPVRDFPKPSAELEDPFSMVTGAMELAGGKLLVVDALEGQLTVVDFGARTKTALGRKGSGPGEYRMPSALLRTRGDTVWVIDAGQMKIVTYLPDLTPGVGIPFMMFDQGSNTALTAPYFLDHNGRIYSSAMFIQAGRNAAGGGVKIPDSVAVVRLDPRGDKTRTPLMRVRFPVSGTPEIKVDGNRMKYTMPFPGLVAADAWAAFPDGRLAVVHGGTYAIEFIAPDGKRSGPFTIAYDRIPLSATDRKAELDSARRTMQEQSKAVQKMMPAGRSLQLDLLEPASWPNEYPPISPMGALAAPDGRLWVRRAIPVKVGREQWDVIDPYGKLAGRWRLPARTSLVAVGAGVVYTIRTDEDDLRYLQRITLPGK